MSRGFNRVVLIGNVGKDPDVRYTTSGVPVATFSLATSEMWKDKDGTPQERTDWHNIVAWRKLAEIIQEIVRKGSRLLVEGKIQTRSFEKNGEKRYVTEIVADNILLLDGRKSLDDALEESGNGFSSALSPERQSFSEPPPDEDLPF
ncbi:MAG: single-stranded DNA-binding protein [Bacteroidota bacterium]|nr:single-stranded DNA-binding protein [Candidatus Kapabacteria bacterium]MDW8220388.1 single-stranded DNA-binding protein [Bacteroidota bacterium]